MGYCEIINEYPYDSFDYDMLNSYDVEYTIHAPLSDINVASHNESIRNASISLIKNSMDIACKLDSEIVVVHPGYMPILGRKITPKVMAFNRNSLKECSNYAEEVGVKMCVENMPDIENLMFTNLDDLNELILDIDAYMTLDVGHAHNNNYTVEDMLKYSRVEHIHLSDNDGSYDSHHALGNNKEDNGIEFITLFEDLRKINYGGFLVVEVEEPESVKESIDFIKYLNNKRAVKLNNKNNNSCVD
jgi:sugar phosphate isomerase/epimerase